MFSYEDNGPMDTSKKMMTTTIETLHPFRAENYCSRVALSQCTFKFKEYIAKCFAKVFTNFVTIFEIRN